MDRLMRIANALMVSALLSSCTADDGPTSAASSIEFVPLFDGQSLDQWVGREDLWSVEEGIITGQTDVALAENTFLVRDGIYRNFEVRLKYRMTTDLSNTGLQYRSRPLPGQPFVVAGYQANIVTKHADKTFAMLFDEYGRDMMVGYGEKARIVPDDSAELGFRSIIESCVNSKSDIMAAQQPFPAWNDYVIIAYENHLIHALNGVVTLEVIDEDPRAPREGQFALQIHRDMIMGAQFKDLEVRTLYSPPELTDRFVVAGPALTADGTCP